MSSKSWKAQLRTMSMFWWALSLECRGCPFCSAFKGKVKEIGNFVTVLAASWRPTFEIWPNSLPKTQSPDMISLGIMVSMNNPGQLIFSIELLCIMWLLFLPSLQRNGVGTHLRPHSPLTLPIILHYSIPFLHRNSAIACFFKHHLCIYLFKNVPTCRIIKFCIDL